MIPKAFDLIDKADIEGLLSNRVPEGRSLDYKLKLPGGSDEDKREFLADVSSCANASGGDLIFGVSEAGGVPDVIPGLAGANMDAEKLRLEESIRTGLAPRIVGVQMRHIDGFGSGPVLVLRIPRSFGAPHMVTFKNYSRFFSRNSAGKYQLDVVELRAAFEVSGALAERLQRFRTDRVAKIVAGETPVMIPNTPKLILHVLPLSAFNLNFFSGIANAAALKFKPIATGSWDHRINIDGILTFSRSTGGPRSDTYCQLFRNGAIEAVYADFVEEHEKLKTIGSEAYERDLLVALQQYLPGLKEFGVPLPLLITLSMVGVKGVELATGNRPSRWAEPIDRDALLLPDVLLEDYGAHPAGVMRPIFDAVWNAAGHERSGNYDPNGIWMQRH